MFYLNKKNIDCDEFGWWLTGSKPTETEINSDMGDDDNRTKYVDSLNEPILIGNEHSDDDEDGEIISGEEPICKTSSRSYTPERLIRSQDYSILTASPGSIKTERELLSTSVDVATNKRGIKRRDDENFNSNNSQNKKYMNNLIDKKLPGAKHLESIILDPNRLDIKVSGSSSYSLYLLNRRKLINDFYKKNKNLLDFLKTDYSPKRILTPDLINCLGTSCERKKSFDRDNDRPMSNNLLDVKDDSRDKIEEDNDDDRDSEDFDYHFHAKISHDRYPEFESDKKINEKSKVNVLEIIGEKIKRIEDKNKNIFRDVSLLKYKFQMEEKKTGNLTIETTRLRQEIRDLRYIDDLVNLLNGKFERISNRDWPFNICHIDNNNEEINLVV